MTQCANNPAISGSDSRLILSRLLLAVAYLIAVAVAVLSFSPQLRLAERRASPARSGGSGVEYGQEDVEGRYGGRRARRLEDEEAAFNASFDFSLNETWKEGFFNMTLEIEKWRAGGGCDRFRERFSSHLHVDLLQDDDPASWPPNPSLQVGTSPHRLHSPPTASPHCSMIARAHHHPFHPPPPFSLTPIPSSLRPHRPIHAAAVAARVSADTAAACERARAAALRVVRAALWQPPGAGGLSHVRALRPHVHASSAPLSPSLARPWQFSWEEQVVPRPDVLLFVRQYGPLKEAEQRAMDALTTRPPHERPLLALLDPEAAPTGATVPDREIFSPWVPPEQRAQWDVLVGYHRDSDVQITYVGMNDDEARKDLVSNIKLAGVPLYRAGSQQARRGVPLYRAGSHCSVHWREAMVKDILRVHTTWAAGVDSGKSTFTSPVIVLPLVPSSPALPTRHPTLPPPHPHAPCSTPLDKWTARTHCVESRYKFAIAVENSERESYATEKLFIPFDAGQSLPCLPPRQPPLPSPPPTLSPTFPLFVPSSPLLPRLLPLSSVLPPNHSLSLLVPQQYTSVSTTLPQSPLCTSLHRPCLPYLQARYRCTMYAPV
ncbi:unnamed protein product [Closterium sp. NIES-65]|nr:unnamed protein product [Closterium sp. NIES-65]